MRNSGMIQKLNRMKLRWCVLLVLVAVLSSVKSDLLAQDFGDSKSSTLVTKAWEALAAGEHDNVTAYTKKCCELYQDEAKKQQSSLSDFAGGDDDTIHSYWALNDVGTILFIQGESLSQQGKSSEAVEAYKSLVDDYGFCQCCDPQGWFWKPSEAAVAKIKELDFDAQLDD